jgi:hypothetical protein
VSDGLRYLQVFVSVEQGKNLPGADLTMLFDRVSLITPDCIVTNEPCYVLQFEGDFSNGYEHAKETSATKLIHTYSVSDTTLIASCILTGPIPKLVHEIEGAWLQTPSTLLRSNGLMMTVLGTTEGLNEVRIGLDRMIPGDIKLRITTNVKADWVAAPHLPERRKEVIDLAVQMGYYHTPRKCTQRDIANALDVRQGTVAEHLQSAEGLIIKSWSDQTK